MQGEAGKEGFSSQVESRQKALNQVMILYTVSQQTELRTEVSAELADRLENFFFETETSHWGVMQRERDDPFEVFGYFPDAPTAEAEWIALRNAFPELPGEITCRTVADTDWQNAYKAYVKAWSNRQLNWVPLWERETVRLPDEAAVVYLDAGMAFGTGAHETTRLCARRLLDYAEGYASELSSREVIDAGCGSGVLAFSAKALGFVHVHGFDFDPEALRVCRENIGFNDHLAAPTFSVADLEAGLAGRHADLLLANIQTDVLLPNADTLLKALRPGATLALSGILAKELGAVRDHYLTRCAELWGEAPRSEDSRVDGEWADFCLVRV